MPDQHRILICCGIFMLNLGQVRHRTTLIGGYGGNLKAYQIDRHLDERLSALKHALLIEFEALDSMWWITFPETVTM